MSAAPPETFDPLVDRALSALETLVPLLPRGWTEAEVELAQAGGLRVKSVTTRLHAGSTAPLPEMGLNVGH